MLGLVSLGLVSSVGAQEGLGISSWCGWNPGQVSRVDCPELRSVPLVRGWSQLEPKPGHYEFDRHIGDPLRAAAEEGLCVFLMAWVRPTTPQWLFDEKGVPRVYTDRAVNPLGKKMSKADNLHPYYFDPHYEEHFFELIDKMGAYVGGLPKALRERIVFVQSAEGSTGDGQPYKGKPLEAKYDIPEKEWNDFRRETWIRYQKAFRGIPILVNSDANTANENDWLLTNMDVIALKHGMFSHGYHVSENVERMKDFDAIAARAKKIGKPVLTRGEQDGEMFVYGWSTRNIPQALYWSGLFASHCRLDVWNIPHQALKDEANFPAFTFFNRYAGLHDPAAAPRAFCALRVGLDASDYERFPASEFGGREGQKKNVDRYLKIAAAYKTSGARMDDPGRATGGGMLNRKRMGCNDVGWGILPGNYSRFLTQVDPGSGDVGLWNIDDSIYGRFARAFEHQSSKNQMCFRLAENFNAEHIGVRITYLDRGEGRWSLGVSGQSGKRQVRNTDSGEWKTLTVSMARNVLRNAELLLQHEGGGDTVFHMIEIEKESHSRS